ncbi:hypothetical protein CTAYLR_004268 [Chrysophaeum taylorii]|uniref:Phosphoribosyltransferase domain-containing protein n=1 Tax=Chrysophaeum taylorii TaxID=2483200 RepID=A0AAD7XKT7_9STRA|nr:hypothetical protein CTAYLR_004268 [Chrysophaeum taylorii]
MYRKFKKSGTTSAQQITLQRRRWKRPWETINLRVTRSALIATSSRIGDIEVAALLLLDGGGIVVDVVLGNLEDDDGGDDDDDDDDEESAATTSTAGNSTNSHSISVISSPLPPTLNCQRGFTLLMIFVLGLLVSPKLKAFKAPASLSDGLEAVWVGSFPADVETMAVHHLREWGVELHSFHDIHCDENESAATVAEWLHRQTGYPALAEHTTLEIGDDYFVSPVDDRADALLAKLATSSGVATFSSTVAFHDGTRCKTANASVTVVLQLAKVSTALCSKTEAIHSLTMTLAEDSEFVSQYSHFVFEWFEHRRQRALTPRRRYTGAALLRERIRDAARVLPNGDVDVSSFVGSSVDVQLLDACAEETISRLDVGAITKILTTGASGQQFALPIARQLSVPLVCARRENQIQTQKLSSPLGRVAYADSVDVTYQSKHFGPGQQLFVPQHLFSANDNVLVVDDFLASGSCQEAMLRLVARAGATPFALAVLIEKKFERARDFLAGYDIPVISLATILSVDNNYIDLEEPPPEKMRRNQQQLQTRGTSVVWVSTTTTTT